MIDKEQVINQIKQIFDPEIPVNIWDLGLVYNIDVQENDVGVKMSLTSPACPSAKQIPDMVRSRILTIPGVSRVNIEIVWEPQWNPSMISEEGKKILKLED